MSTRAWGLTPSPVASPNQAAAVESIPVRDLGSNIASAGASVGASGAIRFTYFTAQSSRTVTNVVTITGTTAAGATPTLCRVGLWSVDAAGDLTLVASTANTTTLWAATNTEYVTALGSAFAFQAGQRYAAGTLIVTGAAVPTLLGYGPPTGFQATMGLAPRVSGTISGQVDLPASVAAGTVNGVAIQHYFQFR